MKWLKNEINNMDWFEMFFSVFLIILSIAICWIVISAYFKIGTFSPTLKIIKCTDGFYKEWSGQVVVRDRQIIFGNEKETNVHVLKNGETCNVLRSK